MTKKQRDEMNALITDEMTLEETFEALEQYQEANPSIFDDPTEAAYDLFDYFEEYGGEEAYEPAYKGPVPLIGI